jgi:hypothetical protein
MKTDELAAHDAHGAPYTVPRDIDYGMAIEIALSRHPSRVVANTNVYRYARFTFPGTGAVDVHMFGQHIARFRPDGVQLWARGYNTVSTTEALSNLCNTAWFYSDKRDIYVAQYAEPTARRAFTEGETFPYRSETT